MPGNTDALLNAATPDDAPRASEPGYPYRSLIESLPDLVYRYRFSPRGYEYVSPVSLRLVGYAPAEFYADPDFHSKIVHPDDKAYLISLFSNPVAAEAPAPVRWLRNDGATVWTELHHTLVRDQAGRVAEILGISRDITSRKLVEAELRASEARATALIRNAPVGIYEVDLLGRSFKSVNDYLCELLGYTREELLAIPPGELLDEESRRVFGERIRRSLAGKPVDESVEYRARARDGHLVYAVLKTTFTYKDGKPDGALVIAHDITDRRLAEMQREELLKSERAARAEAEDAIRLRDQFISIASHELRTPLTSIAGYQEILQLEARAGLSPFSERALRAVEAIGAQSRRLNLMIGELLDVSRIESGQFLIEREPLDLSTLARRVVQEAAPRSKQHSITLRDEGPFIVMGDPARLEQVIENLVSNAIKYSPQGGPVEVVLIREGETVALSVSDHGIGIPAEDLPHLFRPYQRAGNTARISGLGVGLYVVREIVQRHGGAIRVESEEGKGSAFTVCLPLEQI